MHHIGSKCTGGCGYIGPERPFRRGRRGISRGRLRNAPPARLYLGFRAVVTAISPLISLLIPIARNCEAHRPPGAPEGGPRPLRGGEILRIPTACLPPDPLPALSRRPQPSISVAYRLYAKARGRVGVAGPRIGAGGGPPASGPRCATGGFGTPLPPGRKAPFRARHTLRDPDSFYI